MPALGFVIFWHAKFCLISRVKSNELLVDLVLRASGTGHARHAQKCRKEGGQETGGHDHNTRKKGVYGQITEKTMTCRGNVLIM